MDESNGIPQRRSVIVAPKTEDNLYVTRMPSSTRRYMATGSRPTTRQVIVHPEYDEKQSPSGQRKESSFQRLRWQVHIFLGAAAVVILAMLLSALFSWWQGVQDNAHYGYPRTSQLDAVVGHNDSQTNQTHFIFLNLHGHIEVIELPGGDASHSRIFTGPTLVGAGQDLIPVTGEIRNEDGRRDLIVHIQDQQIVYINDGSTFHQQGGGIMHKIRFWDTHEKRMIYADEAQDLQDVTLAVGLHDLPIAIDKDSFRDGDIVAWNVDHRYVRMDAIGLSDWSDKEIYDWDIVLLEGVIVAKVIYSTGGYIYYGKDGSRIAVGEIAQENVRVIGNIWNNPEMWEG